MVCTTECKSCTISIMDEIRTENYTRIHAHTCTCTDIYICHIISQKDVIIIDGVRSENSNTPRKSYSHTMAYMMIEWKDARQRSERRSYCGKSFPLLCVLHCDVVLHISNRTHTITFILDLLESQFVRMAPTPAYIESQTKSETAAPRISSEIKTL